MLDEVFFLPRDEKGEVKEAPGAPPDEAAGEAQKARNCALKGAYPVEDTRHETTDV